MTDLFIPAEWDQTYNLAGAEWTPGATDTGVYIKRGQLGAVNDGVINILPDGYEHVGDCYPLLPSPDWINEQSDPRAVAIAALKRAGFGRPNPRPDETDPLLFLNFYQAEDYADEVSIELLEPHILAFSTERNTDPALSRYAQNCFEVLHAWAGKINWEAQDADC